ncbi:MAG: ABC transporter substrate-binding protein, partial [Promethearchaeota archaeon]
LAKIGIKVTAAGMTYTEFLYRIFEVGGYSRNYLQLYWWSWVPEYNDPSAYINFLFTNRSVAYNSAQVNDFSVQQWMEEALEESDQSQREILYDKIQKRLVEEIYPWVWGTVEKLYYAHHINLTGFQPNVLKKHYFYPCQWDPWYISPRVDATFIIGVSGRPIDIDPHDVRDTRSYQIIDQVYEGLYGYNYSDPEMEIIPYLATTDGVWSPDGLNYTIPLRSGVTFHDGAPFNASAVKFSFDRLGYLMDNDMVVVEDLYNFRDETPIINRTEVIDTYTIRFILNAPYTPLQALLCFSGSYILSPKSTPATTIIDLITGDIVGTGPFVYDNYIFNVEVNFHSYNNYWRGKADTELMKFKIYDNPDERMAALLTGDIDFIDNLLPEWTDIFKSRLNITVLDEGKTNSYISYLGMNNRQINPIFREAISYAIDYDYIVNEIREGQVERLKSPVPDGIRYANSTFDYPVLNLTRARLNIQSLGYGIGFDLYSDEEWEYAAFNTPFATYNYTYNFGYEIREDILDLLQDNLAKIGIKVTAAGMTYTEFLYRIFEVGGYSRNYLQLYWWHSLNDFNDPSNTIDWLFLNTSLYNHAQVDDGQVSKWIQDALTETDAIQREKLYDNIQKRLVEEVYPWAWGTVEKLYTAFHEDLTGFQQNTLERLYLYPCKWNRKAPGTFALSSDAGTPDDDAIFNLTWTTSDGAINYTVYQHSDYITVINESLTILADGIADLNITLSGYSDGTYYFIVVAYNQYGDTLSNCHQVDVLATKSLTITIPDSFSSWEIGTSQYINWTSTGVISNVKMELYKDDVYVMEITLNTSNDGKYHWTISSTLESSTQYQVKVSDESDPSIYDFSDYFEIYTPAITITTPDSSSSWETGTSQYINWTYIGTISNVKIELYKDDLFVMEITSDTFNDGIYHWNIASFLEDSTQYQIKITDASNPSIYDFSDYFEIKQPPSEGIPLTLIITVSVVGGGAIITIAILYQLRRKKRKT